MSGAIFPRPIRPDVLTKDEKFQIGEFELQYRGMSRYNAVLDIRKSGSVLAEGIELEMKKEKRIQVGPNTHFRITVHLRNRLFLSADIVLDDIEYF